MWPKKPIWQLYCSYLLLMAVPVLFVTWYASQNFRKLYLTQTLEDLKSRAYLIGSQIQEHIAEASTGDIDSLCKVLSTTVPTRFTVITISGQVIGDSEKNPDSMENHGSRPEVIAALKGGIGVSDRYSHTLEEDMMYVAMPLYTAGSLAAVVRTALPVTAIKTALNRLYANIAVAVGLMALLAAFVSYLVSIKSSRPVAEMKLGAQRFAAGDFSFKLRPTGFEETDGLAVALNDMAHRLSATINTITEQKNERDAVLSSMVEGVIAVDAKGRVITVNQAAARMFDIDPAGAAGKWIGEALRNVEVQDFLDRTITSPGPVESEVLLLPFAGGTAETSLERFLQLHGSALRDAAGQSIGGLMVASDITQIKQLENMRKDFVANVSHEMRTPLTSIKGYIETLLSGAMNSPDDAGRFLGIVATQVDRLTTIVEDLLSLSQLERDSASRSVELKETKICGVLRAALEDCRHVADRKRISVSLSCDDTIAGLVEPSLLEQAVVNLLDNALKYSEEDRRVWVKAAFNDKQTEIVVSVQDEGPGIEQQHLDRLFERFYRVDKARSRKLGGTGLGLSIVKHIAAAHNGRVSVQSTPGTGSTFFMYLPVQS